MVRITHRICIAVLVSGFAFGLPRTDNIINEVVAPAPYGIPMTHSVASTAMPEATPKKKSSKPQHGGYDVGGKDKAQDSSWDKKPQKKIKNPAPSDDKPPVYGSGYAKWNQGYNDCVQKCMANQGNFPTPSTTYKPAPTQSSNVTGTTHTVIVAPTQGVLRYVPFALNASVGDTVKFMWGANNHTVTKSSVLLPCNKSLNDAFASGTQNKDFVFNLLVNDTEPVYFFCGTPTHCQKGMFAMVNPPSTFNGPTSMANMMASMVANNSDIAAYSAYASSLTASKPLASKWGSNIDVGALPEWSHRFVAENVLYTQSFIGSNAEALKSDGSVDLSIPAPWVIPKDVKAVLASSTTPGSSSSSSSASETAPTTSRTVLNSSAYLQSAGLLTSSPKILITTTTIATLGMFLAL